MKTRIPLLAILLWLALTGNLIGQVNPPGGGSGGGGAGGPITNTYVGSKIDLVIQHIGTLRIELFDQDKPVTTRNFINYIFNGGYSNSFIHRSLTNFVVQGGSLQLITFSGGSQAIAPVPEETAVTNELTVGRVLSNLRGTIALAHYDGETNNGTCHWFINLADNAWLDAADTNHAYTVFGRVVSGLELLDKMNPGTNANTVTMLDMGGYLTELPVRQGATAGSVTYNDLLTTTYRIVQLEMGVRISPQPDGSRNLAWQSVSNFVNTVEYATSILGPWQTLHTTNGNGATLTVNDAATGGQRFYRATYH